MINSPQPPGANPLNMSDLPRCAAVLPMTTMTMLMTTTIIMVVFMDK